MKHPTRIAVGALALSAAGLVSIVAFEGYTSTAVRPLPGDVPTIGFGTTAGVAMGDTITPPAALGRALRDVQTFESALKECVHVPLYQHEYDAYLSLLYNIGPGKEGVKDGFCWLKRGGPSTLVTRLNAYDYPGACRAILSWTYFQGKNCANPANKCTGLAKRRQAEYAQCMGAAAP